MTWPPPWTRRPLCRIQPAAGDVSTPMSWSALTPRGVSPSPQTFSRGKADFSRRTTSRPARASQYAALEPAGPAPTTITSAEAAAPLLSGTSCAPSRTLPDLVNQFTKSPGPSLGPAVRKGTAAPGQTGCGGPIGSSGSGGIGYGSGTGGGVGSVGD